MPENYPRQSPPTYEMSAPFLKSMEKQQLYNKLEEIYADNFVGEPVRLIYIIKPNAIEF